jgi:hypothetical protein
MATRILAYITNYEMISVLTSDHVYKLVSERISNVLAFCRGSAVLLGVEIATERTTIVSTMIPHRY